MKRSLVFSLVTLSAIVFLTVPATATAFTYVTLNVPSGWSATESESGVVVLVNDSNRTDRILIQLGVLSGTTLQTAANIYYSSLNGTGGLQQDDLGYYYFVSQITGSLFMTHILQDHNTYSIVPEGYFWYTGITLGGTARDVFFDEIFSTIEFHAEYTSGSVQTFSRMKVLVPEGWSAEENDEDGTVALYSSLDSKKHIEMFVGNTGGDSLQAIAEEYCNTLNGQELARSGATSGYYWFSFVDSEGNGCTAFVDDSTTDSRVPDGYYWFQATSNVVGGNVFSAVLRSVVITVGDTGNDDNRGSSGGNGSTSDIDKNINRDNIGYTDGSYSTGDGDSNSGCSAGFSAAALLSLCAVFRLRKSR